VKNRAPIATLPTVLALVAAAGCHHVPPTRLPERPIDDPVTLPAKTGELGVNWGPRFPDPGSPGHWPIGGGVSIGLSPRLQLDLPLSLVYAVMEERPSDGRPAQPVTLAVGGGLAAFGFGTPVAGAWLQGELLAKKRLGQRWRIDAAVELDAPTRLGPNPGTVGHGVFAHLGVTLQIGKRWTLAGGIQGNVNDERQLFAHEVGFLSSVNRSRWLSVPLTLRWRIGPSFDALLLFSETVQRTYYDPNFGAPLATPRSPSTERFDKLAVGGLVRW
jgi:hypothetical protein